MQDKEIEKHLLVVSDNSQGYDDRALAALGDVCEAAEINLFSCLDIPAEFYRLPTRYELITLPMIIQKIQDIIDAAVQFSIPDFIITHNPFGEYGHGDHRLIFNIVSTYLVPFYEVRFTDICQFNKCHLSQKEISPSERQAYFRNSVGSYVLNKEWFAKLRKIYTEHGAWSWGEPHEITSVASVYRI